MSAAPPWPDPALMLALVAVTAVGFALIVAVARTGRTQAVHRDEWLDKVAGATPDPDTAPAEMPVRRTR